MESDGVLVAVGGGARGVFSVGWSESLCGIKDPAEAMLRIVDPPHERNRFLGRELAQHQRAALE